MACSQEILDFMESCYEQENRKNLYKPPVLCFDLLEEVGKQVEIKRNEIYQQNLKKHKEKFSAVTEEIRFLGYSFDGAHLVSNFAEDERNEYNPGWVNAFHDDEWGFIKGFMSQYYITEAVWQSQTENKEMPYWETLGCDYEKWLLYKLVYGENK